MKKKRGKRAGVNREREREIMSFKVFGQDGIHKKWRATERKRKWEKISRGKGGGGGGGNGCRKNERYEET